LKPRLVETFKFQRKWHMIARTAPRYPELRRSRRSVKYSLASNAVDRR